MLRGTCPIINPTLARTMAGLPLCLYSTTRTFLFVRDDDELAVVHPLPRHVLGNLPVLVLHVQLAVQHPTTHRFSGT